MATKVNFTEETKAMDSISRAFEKLDDDAMTRVINWAISAFKVKLENTTNLTTLSQISTNPTTINTPTGGIKNLWQEKKPTNNYQKFALLGYYLEYVKKMNEFTKADLLLAWDECREPKPSKDTLRVALNDTNNMYKYLLPASKKGSYRISTRGHNLVQQLPSPSKELLGTTRKPSKKKSK